MSNDPESQRDGSRSKWMDDAQAAMADVRDALQAAWEETRDTRGSALEAARVAARQLGDAIDQGIGVARQQWDGARDDTDDATSSGSTGTTTTPPTEPPPPPPDTDQPET